MVLLYHRARWVCRTKYLIDGLKKHHLKYIYLLKHYQSENSTFLKRVEYLFDAKLMGKKFIMNVVEIPLIHQVLVGKCMWHFRLVPGCKSMCPQMWQYWSGCTLNSVRNCCTLFQQKANKIKATTSIRQLNFSWILLGSNTGTRTSLGDNRI